MLKQKKLHGVDISSVQWLSIVKIGPIYAVKDSMPDGTDWTFFGADEWDKVVEFYAELHKDKRMFQAWMKYANAEFTKSKGMPYLNYEEWKERHGHEVDIETLQLGQGDSPEAD